MFDDDDDNDDEYFDDDGVDDRKVEIDLNFFFYFPFFSSTEPMIFKKKCYIHFIFFLFQRQTLC